MELAKEEKLNVFNEKDFLFEVNQSDLKIEGVTLDDATRAEIIKNLVTKVYTYKTEIQQAGKEVVKELPMETMLPFVGMNYVAQLAETAKFGADFVEMGFSFDHLNLLKTKQSKLLKKISGDMFKEKNEAGEDALI